MESTSNNMKQIGSFYGTNVFATDKVDTILLNYTSGDVETDIHMNVFTGDIEEKDNNEVLTIMNTLKGWYKDNKTDLINGYESGSYYPLKDWEE